jgi:diguanylate cyclase (GGDEF)-like protein
LVDAFEAGADDYLIKPIIAKIFLARLRAAVRVVKLQEEVANDREQLLRFSAELTKSNELLLHQTLTDPLTGLPNRRMAMDRMNQEWATSGRNNRQLSCMMVDIDHFKSVNDTYGHQAGDEVLKIIAKTLRQSARAQDVVCRYGGEEFLIICPDTKREDAHKLAERIRTGIAALVIDLHNRKTLKVTASMGLTEKTASMPTIDALLHEADINLYAAKAGGRNRTVSS